MNKAIIDTDIFSEITKGVDPTVAANVRAYRTAFPRYTLSAVTFMEVIRGYQKKQATRQLQSFVAIVEEGKRSCLTLFYVADRMREVE